MVNLATLANRLENLSSSGEQGLAPLDHGLFDSRFVDGSLSTRQGSTQTKFQIMADNAFEETQGTPTSNVRTGEYAYRRSSEDAGEISLSYADGDSCAMNLHFTSRDGGWYATRCESGETQNGVWHGGSWSAELADTSTIAQDGLRFANRTLSRDYPLGAAIATLQLPAAIGGSGMEVYSVTGEVPGLTFDAATREVSGTPTTAGVYSLTYTATDSSSDAATMDVRITVSGGESGACTLGQILRAGQSCVYPGSTYALTVSDDGSTVSFLTISSSGPGITLKNRTSRGQTIDLRVREGEDSGTWRIVRLMGEKAPEPDTEPMFAAGTSISDRNYMLNQAIAVLSLPPATRSNGRLRYSLTPAVPGLAFNAASRRLTGTPTARGAREMTYTVADEDGDRASLRFTITVMGTDNPDLTVSSLRVSNTTLTPEQSVTITATVRNEGDLDAAQTTAQLYVSEDSTLSRSNDKRVGRMDVGQLGGGQTQQVRFGVDAESAEGTYYYFVCVDTVNGEDNTSNNCSDGQSVVVRSRTAGPDLVVRSISASESTVRAGDSFRLIATVRNQGEAQSPSIIVRYVQSRDTTITENDEQKDTDRLQGLAASSEGVENEGVRAPTTAGIYYFGACVNPVEGEQNTGNNCSNPVRINVTPRDSGGGGSTTPRTPRPDPVPTQGPDLTLDSPRASDSSPEAGIPFDLSVRVRNRGNQPAQATTVRFYRSTNSRIETTDTVVGSPEPQTGLPTSGSNTLTASLTAPSVPGTYYYGACAAPVVNELNVTNNCSSAASIRVRVDGPNLAVDASASTTQPRAGRSFELRATVRNIGNQQAEATMLTFYRSDDAEITTGDLFIQVIEPQQNPRDFAVLGASGSRSFTLTVTAPDTAGTMYYGACVGSVSGDADSGNNCSSGVKVTVPGSDLVIESVKVDDATPEPGDRIELSVTIRNRGTADAEATTLTYYRSTDTIITTSDQSEGTDAVKGLDPRESEEESLRFAAQTTVGVYYYGACIATFGSEGDATNNCSDAVLVKVGAPDLEVQSPRLDDRTPEAGERFILTVRVRNIGHAEAPATTLQFYLSDDDEMPADDEIPADDERRTETASVGSLSINEYSDESGRLTAPEEPKDYFVYACVPDNIPAESNTANNCSTPLKITVPAPNLTVDRPSADDSTLDAGDRFSLTVRIRNRGAGTADDSTLTYYRSDDETIDSDDTNIGTDTVSDIPPSSSETETITITAESMPGFYYYGACVSMLDSESNKDDNCSSALRVTVLAPDLVVLSPSVNDSTLKPNDLFEFSATVSNRGRGTAPMSTLSYYRAEKTDFSDETEVGTAVIVKSLEPRESSREDVDLTAPTPGDYYYRACVMVSPNARESNTKNNCSPGVKVEVDP